MEKKIEDLYSFPFFGSIERKAFPRSSDHGQGIIRAIEQLTRSYDKFDASLQSSPYIAFTTCTSSDQTIAACSLSTPPSVFPPSLRKALIELSTQINKLKSCSKQPGWFSVIAIYNVAIHTPIP